MSRYVRSRAQNPLHIFPAMGAGIAVPYLRVYIVIIVYVCLNTYLVILGINLIYTK